MVFLLEGAEVHCAEKKPRRFLVIADENAARTRVLDDRLLVSSV